MKKLIAYSSVAHMGFVTLGLFTFNQQGVEGGIFQMLSHGIISGALFLCVGVIYDRMHTRLIDRYGGLVNRMPVYAFMFMIFMLGSVGLPGTSGFVGEFLTLLGAYQANTWIAFLAATGVILGAAYMLWLYRRVIFGELTKEDLKSIADLNAREIAMFVPMVIIVIWMGVYPESFLKIMRVSVDNLVMHHAEAIGTNHPPLPGVITGTNGASVPEKEQGAVESEPASASAEPAQSEPAATEPATQPAPAPAEENSPEQEGQGGGE
jgi:NADH-quinone oxidoreductase subunit M